MRDYEYLILTDDFKTQHNLITLEESGEVISYFDEPKGTPDIYKLLNSDPKWWRKKTTKKAPKTKKIIVTDWSFGFNGLMSSETQEKKLSILYTLWQENFTIHVWQDGLIEINDMDELIQRLRVNQPIHKDEIITQLESPSQYVFFDFQTLERMVGHSAAKLEIQYLQKLDAKTRHAIFMTLTEATKIEITFNRYYCNVVEIVEQMANSPIIANCLTLDEAFFNDLVQQGEAKTQLKTIFSQKLAEKINKIKFNCSENFVAMFLTSMMENKTIFSCPMKIVFSEAISYNKLSNIKQSIPNIIKIIFTSDFFFHNSINSWPKDMAKIAIVKDASFTETERSMSLANNSEKSPKIQNENLEKINSTITKYLSGNKIKIKIMEAITPDIARKIGEIKTVDIECYPDTLQMILENCQRTEDITVNLLLDQKISKVEFLFDEKKMPRLKRIKFSTTSINASGLNASYPTFNIRGSSTKLKSLELTSSLINIDKALLENKALFSYLIKLKIDKIDQNYLYDLLRACINLKKLDVYDIETKDTNNADDLLPSNDIEELWLSSGTISEEALIKILNHSPKLRNLNLEISIIGQSNNKLRKLNLEKLSLICCEFPNESTFKSLVTSSEKLKTFVFYQESQSDAFESKLHLLINTLRENPDVIKNLEKMTLSFNDAIKPLKLDFIHQFGKNLREIDLDFFEGDDISFDELFEEKFNCPPRLVNMTMKNILVNQKHVESILKLSNDRNAQQTTDEIQKITIGKHSDDYLVKDFIINYSLVTNPSKAFTDESESSMPSKMIKQLDGNTELTDRPIVVTEYFKQKPNCSVQTNQYRLVPFKFSLKRQCLIRAELKFELYKDYSMVENIENFYTKNFEKNNDTEHFLGKITFDLKPGVWHHTPLPSLNGDEKLVYIEFNPELVFGRDNKKGFYGVGLINKKTVKQTTTIKYIVKANLTDHTPRMSNDLNDSQLQFLEQQLEAFVNKLDSPPEWIEKLTPFELFEWLRLYFNKKFNPGKLDNTNRQDVFAMFQAIMRNKVGACRHRVFSFGWLTESYMEFKKQRSSGLDAFDIEILAIENDEHTFIETYNNNTHRKYDLGGYPINRKTKEFVNSAITSNNNSAQNTTKMEPIQIIEKPAPNNRYITWDHTIHANISSPEDFLSYLIDSLQRGPIVNRLIVVPSENEIQWLNWALMQKIMLLKSHYFYTTLDDIAEKTVKIKYARIDDNHNTLKDFNGTTFNTLISPFARKRKREHNETDHTIQPKRHKPTSPYKKVDSELVQFLLDAESSTTTSVLMVNWDRPKPSQVGFNTLLLETRYRRVYNTRLPSKTQLLLIMTQAEANDMGEDFYNHIEQVFPFNFKLNRSILPSETPHTNNETVNLYHDTDWQSSLLGKVKIQGMNIELLICKLLKALIEKKPGITIINPPWHEASFINFYHQIKIAKKFFYNGKTIHLPESFVISTLEQIYQPINNYELFLWDRNTNWDLNLNEENYERYFYNYACSQEGLQTLPGWLETEEPLTILVTSKLRESQWEKWLATAEEKKTNIKLLFTQAEYVPKCLSHRIKADEPIFNDPPPPDLQDYLPILKPGKALVLQSNDLDCLTESIKTNYKPSLIVSIDENTSQIDLIDRLLQSAKNAEELLQLDHQTNSVWQALEKRGPILETVLLQGQVSSELAMQLETLFHDEAYTWVNGKRKKLFGKLIIATENAPKQWLPFDVTWQRNFSEQETMELAWQKTDNLFKIVIKELLDGLKKNLLYTKPISYQLTKNLVEDINYFRQKTDSMVNAVRKAAKRQFRLEKNAKAIDQWLDKTYSKNKHYHKNQPTKQKRFEKVSGRLEKSPYVFIMGDSGTGKTTFVLDQLPELWQTRHQRSLNLHIGLENVLNWLIAKPKDSDEILFLDEANLEDEGSLEFLEGLFNQPPGILYKGIFYPLSPHHKLIVAGNDSSYANRQMHRLFSRHGCIERFQPLTESDLIDETLNPVFNVLFPTFMEDKNLIYRILLDTYYDVNQQVAGSPLTPRNLASMVLRLGMYWREHQYAFNGNFKLAALLSAYEEVRSYLTPELRTKFKKTLAQKYQPLNTKPCKIALKKTAISACNFSTEYKLTKSRTGVLRRLYDQLLMRQLRIANSQLRKAGTRAIVLEGDSGIGKSVLVIETLRALGYTELTKDSPSCSNGKHYYYLTPTDLEEMETILIKAFHEGAIVVVDELNTLSPLEALLNDLLSGRYKNQPAQQEGFMLIGTQNPANKYKNRKILSKALANRARVETIDNYPVEELEEIVTAITHDLDTAKKETQTFEIAKNYATAFHKHPEPTPRDLCRKTKLLSANTRMEIENDAATTVFTT